MQIIENPNQMQEAAMRLRIEGKLIALVSTSGALHAGHLALIEKAREVADVVVVSVLVNPVEFGPNEDYERYPRRAGADEAFCLEHGVDVLFRPRAQELFPEGYATFVAESEISRGLCGISRPHYFRGVCTYHVQLFNLVRPDHLVLGWRDAQKSAVLRRMVQELHFPTDIILVDTVREADGLPYNARNAYLTDFQRNDATVLYRSLCEGERLVQAGVTSVDRVLAEVTHHLSQLRRIRVIYVAAVNPLTMEPIRMEIVPRATLVMAAVWCDQVRLIDNLLV